MAKKTLEICCYTLESALLAQQAGADRIELCDNYAEGGTTPSFGTIQLAAEQLTIPLHVIVRPRGGDFLYTEKEFEILKRDVQMIKSIGVKGIVVGFLQADGSIDIERTRQIVQLAEPTLQVTFHRAFDMCRDPLQGLQELKQCEISRILTSGGQQTAMEGMELLGRLLEQAGDDITILVGSGVNDANLQELLTKTNAREFHASAKGFQKSAMQYTNANIADMGSSPNNDSSEYQTITVNTGMIQRMKAILKNSETEVALT